MRINASAFGFTEDDWDDDPDHKYAYIENSDELVMIQDLLLARFSNLLDITKKATKNLDAPSI
jgi:hypothetical protein